MKKLTIYIDGRYIKATPKIAEAFTPGVFKAKGVFETMLAVGNKVFDVKAHLARLYRGSGGVAIAAGIIQRVVRANGFDAARVRVLVWKEGRQTHTAVMALKYVLSARKVSRACLIKTDWPATARRAHKKSLDYGLFARAYRRARAQGYEEALLLNRKGYIFEASRANIFWVKGGVLFTPPLSSGCLKGITRQQVIRLAGKLKIPCKEKNCTTAMLKEADAAFLTNSLIGIRRLVKNLAVNLNFPACFLSIPPV